MLRPQIHRHGNGPVQMQDARYRPRKQHQNAGPDCRRPQNSDRHDTQTHLGGSTELLLKVGTRLKERRLDKYLHGRVTEFSRVMLQKHITAGAVTVNGQKVVKPGFRLSPGDRIELALPQPVARQVTPQQIPLQVIYEDDSVIVLNKQARIIVHPARGNTRGTIANALAFYADKLSSGLGEFRPGIIHRLDKNTTGVMVVTKNETAQWKIAKQFQLRQVKKTYLAVVHGTPQLNSDVIDAPIGVDPRKRQRCAVRADTGRQAATLYEVLESFRGFSLLKLTPKTGRTHQIRVHLSYIKHPIAADTLYGGQVVYQWQLADEQPAVQQPVIDRCALHAHALEFRHPASGELVRFEAELPPDMQSLLDMLRKYRKM